MNIVDLQFVVDGHVSGISGRHTVIGRCGDSPIRLGDVFHLAFRAKHRRYPDEIANPIEREVERPVELRVEHIHAYGHCLEMLGQGMTGSLELSGPEKDTVEAGWTLIGKHSADSVVQLTEAGSASVTKS